METLKEFLARPDIKKIKRELPEKLYTTDFNRDPNRAIYHDESVFYSPADGFILYSNVVKPDEDIISVKGMDYTVNELMQEKIKERCMVIGIFMAYVDVHINRIPTNGWVKYEKLDSLKANELSMRTMENHILKEFEVKYDNIEYALYNMRVKNRIFCPWIQQHYWLIQIADFEVDVITHFGDQNDFYTQSERFSVVRMGSQVDLIIPLINKKLRFESLVDDKISWHVEGGVDALIRWGKK